MLKKIGVFFILLLVGIFIVGGPSYFLPVKETVNKINNKQDNLIKDKTIEKSIFKNSYQKARKIVSKMTIKEKVGQLFLVRYNYDDVNYLSNYYPGGYLLFAKDFENHTKKEMIDEINKVQSSSKYPLIMAVDEEGGFVTRISRFPAYRSEKFKSPRDYYQEGGFSLLEETEKEKAELLKELGLNLNLAPVADVSTNENDFIYSRSFGENATKTADYVKKMVEYANNNKIGSCLKHFPGYGNNVDTHTGIAIDERKYEDIKNNDYLPFEAGIKANVPFILVSHNIVKSIDEEYPASLSNKVINELRVNLGYTGIIITDDLAMDAVKEYVDNNNAATLAINSGNDMIITSDYVKMFNEVVSGLEDKTIREETINKAVLRIVAWKLENKLFKEE